ncbi:MAG: ABC transporter substrate-binding protein [Halanaerobiales bacterium]|nr:ABC transporter substrate-binding protein [Halanaerobiales bacterium]
MLRKSSMVLLLLAILISLMSVIGIGKDEIVSIGITQIVEHPALDAARDGFIKALADNGFEDGKNLDIEIHSAQGDLSIASMISEEFVRDKKDLILAIATPTAQAALNASSKIPILITAVTDPVASGLAASLQSSGNNVTGTTDMTPIDEQFSLITELLPNAKKVGVIYNASEINSMIQVELARKACLDHGLKLSEVTVTNVTEVQMAVEQLVKKVDVIYTPTDNLVASAMPVITYTATQMSVPVIGSEAAHVKAGALATLGIDYWELGYQTGIMAVQVLNGANPSSLPIESLKNLTLVINEDTAKTLNITIPTELKAQAELIKAGDGK